MVIVVMASKSSCVASRISIASSESDRWVMKA
jgi:hypothetical protein